VVKEHGFHFEAVLFPSNVMDWIFRSFVHAVLPVAQREGIVVQTMKPMGGKFILESKTVTPAECLQYALSQPTSVMIHGTDKMEYLQQTLDVVKNLRPFSEGQSSALAGKAKQAAMTGKYELLRPRLALIRRLKILSGWGKKLIAGCYGAVRIAGPCYCVDIFKQACSCERLPNKMESGLNGDRSEKAVAQAGRHIEDSHVLMPLCQACGYVRSVRKGHEDIGQEQIDRDRPANPGGFPRIGCFIYRIASLHKHVANQVSHAGIVLEEQYGRILFRGPWPGFYNRCAVGLLFLRYRQTDREYCAFP
jgi:hypothetical protein